MGKTNSSFISKLFISIIMVVIVFAIAIGFSWKFPEVKNDFTCAVSGVVDNVVDKIVEVTVATGSYDPYLPSTVINTEDEFKVIRQKNLDPEMIKLITALSKWGKSQEKDFMIFGGTLYRDVSGEVIWKVDDSSQTLSTILNHIEGEGLIVVNNPRGILVPNCMTTTGTLTIQKAKTRRFGFLWKTDNDQITVESSNFTGIFRNSKDYKFGFNHLNSIT